MIRPPGRPAVRIFRLRLVAPLRVSPKRTFRFCQWPDHRVSPDRSPLVSPSGGTYGLLRLFHSAGGTDRPFPSCPEAGVCGAGLGPRFRVAPVRLPFRLRRCLCELPRLGTAVGSMMNPVCTRTLHPRLAPWMNLRVQSFRFLLPGARSSLWFLPALRLRLAPYPHCLESRSCLSWPGFRCRPFPYRVTN
jgi:hypothetical protein